MIKAYLAGIPSLYEGEDIEIQYCIYEDSVLISRESIIMDYVPPALVGQVALNTLLNKLINYKGKEIVVYVYDTALSESIRGILKTKNKDVLKMASENRRKLTSFENIVIKDVSGVHEELTKWIAAIKE